MERKNIAGMSMKGGKKDNFFFCQIEFFEDQNRWFLRSLLQVKDEAGREGDEAIHAWIEDLNVKELIVDFPLTSPACQTCEIQCPGIKKCPVPTVNAVQEGISNILAEDARLNKENPKRYEQERNKDDEFDFSKDILSKESTHHILSRAFKRRLKKGFTPYWNRTLDFWVWTRYYDQLLSLFNSSFDSFANTSLMILSRFAFLRRHFPPQLELFEGNINIALIELLRAGIILKKDIINMYDMELCIEARLDIIKKIESKLNIFIYDNDLEVIVKNPRAFNSFILAVIGQSIHLESSRELPEWTLPSESKFIVPSFD